MILDAMEKKARDRVCVALDVPGYTEAYDLVHEVGDFVSMFKVGKELHCAAANGGISIIRDLQRAVDVGFFLDLKFHDTPQTVYRACKAAVVPGVKILNLHIAGGYEMCRQAMNGMREKAGSLGIPFPKVIGVTVLTSLDDNDLITLGMHGYDWAVNRRAWLAAEWGLDGIVCPAKHAGRIDREVIDRRGFLYVTPGIQWAGKQGTGQKQLYTPVDAVKDIDNSILVIGSAITKAENRAATAYEIIQAMANAMEE